MPWLYHLWASLVAQLVKNPRGMQETWVRSLGWGRSPGEGNSHPLQYSGLKDSMDCIVHGLAESDTTEQLLLSLFFHILYVSASHSGQFLFYCFYTVSISFISALIVIIFFPSINSVYYGISALIVMIFFPSINFGFCSFSSSFRLGYFFLFEVFLIS